MFSVRQVKILTDFGENHVETRLQINIMMCYVTCICIFSVEFSLWLLKEVWLRRCLTQLPSKSPVAEMVGYEIRSFGK